jgi:hypothetical protein
MDFIEDVYPWQFEGMTDGVHSYRFISSVQAKDITKVVSQRPIESKPYLYNLGFGNLEEKEDGTKFVNDSSEKNNNDFDKVLASVFSCLVHFLNSIQDARVIFFGNTEHKHIMYKRKISANLEVLQEIFFIHGGYADFDLKIKFEQQEMMRNGKKIIRTIKVKDTNTLKIRKIIGLENFNPQKSKEYDFVLISLSAVLN